MAGAWLIVALIERAISLDASRKASALRAAEPPAEAAVPLPSLVNVLQPREAEPIPAGPPALGIPPQLAETPPPPPPIAPPPTEPERPTPSVELPPSVATPPSVAVEPDPLAAPVPTSWPVAVPIEAATPGEREPEPTPEPVAAAPPLQAVPAPPPEPPPPPPSPEPARTVVPLIPAGPRVWNLWELERLAREHGGLDAARDEERSFMLMYLREFAAADGSLPTDFDTLVREAFGDVIGAPT
jgi:hypothetical protein